MTLDLFAGQEGPEDPEVARIMEEVAQAERALAPNEEPTPWTSDERSIVERFAEFHIENPHVLEGFFRIRRRRSK